MYRLSSKISKPLDSLRIEVLLQVNFQWRLLHYKQLHISLKANNNKRTLTNREYQRISQSKLNIYLEFLEFNTEKYDNYIISQNVIK